MWGWQNHLQNLKNFAGLASFTEKQLWNGKLDPK